MGSFNLSCGISRSPLPPGCEVMLIMIAGGTRRKNTVYVSDHYTNIGMAVPATYYDYGQFNIPDSPQSTIVRNVIVRSAVDSSGEAVDHSNTTLKKFTKLLREDSGIHLRSFFPGETKELQCFPVLKHVWDALITESYQDYRDVKNVAHFIAESQEEDEFTQTMKRMDDTMIDTLRSLVGKLGKDGEIFTEEKLNEMIDSRPPRRENIVHECSDPSRRSYGFQVYLDEVNSQHYDHSVPKDDLVLAHAQTQFFIDMMDRMHIPFSPAMYSGQDYDLLEHAKYLGKIAAAVAQHGIDNYEESFETAKEITPFEVREIINASTLRAEVNDNSPNDAIQFENEIAKLCEREPGSTVIEIPVGDSIINELVKYSTIVTAGNGLFIDIEK